jgi:hypothetical protein
VAKLKNEQLRRFARLGAMARLEQLKMEEAAIRAQFPELFGRGTRSARISGPIGPRRGRRPMSAAERRSVSLRMKKYWAARRKAKGAK